MNPKFQNLRPNCRSLFVCGHMTHARFFLKTWGARPWAVDDFRHWNFSICKRNLKVMALLKKQCGSNFCFYSKTPYFETSCNSNCSQFSLHISGNLSPNLLSRDTFGNYRDQELSFGTKIYGIFFIIDEDISSQKNEKKREVLWRSLYLSVSTKYLADF